MDFYYYNLRYSYHFIIIMNKILPHQNFIIKKVYINKIYGFFPPLLYLGHFTKLNIQVASITDHIFHTQSICK